MSHLIIYFCLFRSGFSRACQSLQRCGSLLQAKRTSPTRCIIMYVAKIILEYYTTADFGVSAPMNDAVKLRVQTVHNSVNATSKYKGPPTATVDRAWRDLFESKWTPKVPSFFLRTRNAETQNPSAYRQQSSSQRERDGEIESYVGQVQ